MDISPAQLQTARRCQERFGMAFPLIESDAADAPLAGASFDLVVSECGASLYCDPGRWIPEAARLLRPGGRLVFDTLSVLVALCLAGGGPAGRQLVRPQREVSHLNSDRGVEFHPGHGEWIRTLRAAGFVIDALHELYAPPGARDQGPPVLPARHRALVSAMAGRGDLGSSPADIVTTLERHPHATRYSVADGRLPGHHRAPVLLERLGNLAARGLAAPLAWGAGASCPRLADWWPRSRRDAAAWPGSKATRGSASRR